MFIMSYALFPNILVKDFLKNLSYEESTLGLILGSVAMVQSRLLSLPDISQIVQF